MPLRTGGTVDNRDPLPSESERLDDRLGCVDAERLKTIFESSGQQLSPPFYNCFNNAFANSPNFAKRLARTPQPSHDA
jgi:hypothetical protein